MKKISILCTFVFVIGMMMGSVPAQECIVDDDCAEPLKCDAETGDCIDPGGRVVRF